MYKGGKTLSDYEIDNFIGEAKLIKEERDISSSDVLIIKGKLFCDKPVKKIIDIKPKWLVLTSIITLI